MNFIATANLAVDGTAGHLSATNILISRRVGPKHISLAWNGALPAGSSIQVLVLKDGGTAGTVADYDLLATLTAPGTIRVAEPRGVLVQALSAAAAGSTRVTVIAQ